MDYFLGPKQNGSFDETADYIELVLPKEAYCKYDYNFQDGSSSEILGVCAILWAKVIYW